MGYFYTYKGLFCANCYIIAYFLIFVLVEEDIVYPCFPRWDTQDHPAHTNLRIQPPCFRWYATLC